MAQQQINEYHEELTGSTLDLGGSDANSDDCWTSEWWDAALSLANDWFSTAPTEPPKEDDLPTDLDGMVLLCKSKGCTSRESIQEFFFGLPDEKWFQSMVDLARMHPSFQAFVDDTNAYYEMLGEWIFGDDQKGDCIEDLADFCNYLINGPLLAPPREVEGPPACKLLTMEGKEVYSNMWGESRLICWSMYFILVDIVDTNHLLPLKRAQT